MLDTSLMELEIADSMFERAMTNLINLDNIDSEYYTESFEDVKEKVKDFFDEIIVMIQNFFEKCKEIIREKIETVKFNKAVNDLKKAGIKGNHKISVSGRNMVNNKVVEKTYNDMIKIIAKAAKDIRNAKSSEEIERIYEKTEKVYDKIEQEIEMKKITGELTVDMFGNIIEDSTIDYMSKNTKNVINELLEMCDKISQEIAADEEVEKLVEEHRKKSEKKRAAIAKLKSLATKFSSAAKKCGNVIVKNKTISISILAGLAVAVGGGIGGKKLYNKRKASRTTSTSSKSSKGFNKTNDDIEPDFDFEESAYDDYSLESALDEMMYEMNACDDYEEYDDESVTLEEAMDIIEDHLYGAVSNADSLQESVNDLRLRVFEAYESGTIDEEDKEMFLEYLDLENYE